jgi:hypothetical protein
MDVIGFLCNNRVQLHDSLGSRRACACSMADFNSQNGNRSWVCTTEEQRSVMLFCGQRIMFFFVVRGLCFLLWSDDPMQRISMKNVCCLRWEVFVLSSGLHFRWETWQTFRWWRKVWNVGAVVAETAVKRLPEHVAMLVEDMSRNKCFFFPASNIHVVRFIFICDLFTDFPS